MTAKMRRNVVTAIATVMLAITYVACGFVAVAGIPQMVHGLAMSYCNDDLSPFDKMQLVEAADATRDYTVGEHDYDALMATIAQINDEADTPYAGASAEELAAADEQYTLTPDAHLASRRRQRRGQPRDAGAARLRRVGGVLPALLDLHVRAALDRPAIRVRGRPRRRAVRPLRHLGDRGLQRAVRGVPFALLRGGHVGVLARFAADLHVPARFLDGDGLHLACRQHDTVYTFPVMRHVLHAAREASA